MSQNVVRNCFYSLFSALVVANSFSTKVYQSSVLICRDLHFTISSYKRRISSCM